MELKNITPEQAGIPSEAINKYMDALEEYKVNLHGFIMMRGKEIIAEGYYPPFHKDYIHRMYSISKSFTSIAIGLLIDEGKLSFDDKICDYFQDKLEKETPSYIKEITIRDMLKMATAHKSTTYKRYDGNDWVKSFFVLAPSHMPGTAFSYDTSSSHVLAALVERLSGKSILDYLRDKFLNEIGFSKEARWLKDPQGVSQGGTGLLCTMRDLAKVAYVCMKEGKLGEAQLLPKEYIKEATMKQISTDAQAALDDQFGYGYQIWKTRHNGFAFLGMGGQLALCFPEHDFIYMNTADTQGNPVSLNMQFDAFYQHVYPYVARNKSCLPENPVEYQNLKKRIDNLKTAVVEGKSESEIKTHIAHKRYYMDENVMNLKWIEFHFDGTKGKVTFENTKGQFEIPFGFGSYKTIHEKSGQFEIMSCAAFVRENELYIKSLLMGDCFANIQVMFSFKDNYVTINSKRAAENMLNEYDGIACGHYSL